MKAIIIYAPGDIRYADVKKPKPGPREVLTKVSYCGICGTDVEIFHGDTSLAKSGMIQYPVRIGHEWSGIVEEVGSEVPDFKPGDRVISDTGSSCGKCVHCLEGDYKHCASIMPLGTVYEHREGAFAEYILMPHWHLHKLPDNISLEEGAMVEPATIALYAVINCRISPGSVVLVMGTGAIGLSAVAMAKYKGARVLLAGRKDMKLEIGREMGADAVVNVTRDDLRDFVMSETRNAGLNVFLETTGAATYINQALDLTRYMGIIGLVGFYEKSMNDFDINRLVMEHKSLLGCEGSAWLAPQVIDLISKGFVTLKPMITHKIPFSSAIDAIRTARENTGDKIKTLVEIGTL